MVKNLVVWDNNLLVEANYFVDWGKIYWLGETIYSWYKHFISCVRISYNFLIEANNLMFRVNEAHFFQKELLIISGISLYCIYSYLVIDQWGMHHSVSLFILAKRIFCISVSCHLKISETSQRIAWDLE